MIRRTIFTGLALAASAAVFAQAPFTIVRPVDGTKVREMVRIDIPRNSVPRNAYIGIYINGKFVEAIGSQLLSTESRFYSYYLDTKKNKIEDGPAKIELLLYIDNGGQTKVVDRSSVQVIVGNTNSIKVPLNGLKLKYKFSKKQELPYNMSIRVAQDIISNEQAKKGGRAAELTSREEFLRYNYAIDNLYNNGDALVRLQPLPQRGKDYAFLTVGEDVSTKKYVDNQFMPLYMRIKDNGRQVFGAVPIRSHFTRGDVGDFNNLDLFGIFPLPILPSNNQRPGDVWRSSIQQGQIDLGKLADINSLVDVSPARAEFLKVEWQSGYPCAVIKQVIEVGQTSEKEKVEQMFWFAIDRGVIVRMTETFSIISNVQLPVDRNPPPPNNDGDRRKRRGTPKTGEGGGGNGANAEIMTPQPPFGPGGSGTGPAGGPPGGPAGSGTGGPPRGAGTTGPPDGTLTNVRGRDQAPVPAKGNLARFTITITWNLEK